MIGKLTGTISDIFETYIILDCHDVGYKITLSLPLLQKAVQGNKQTYYIYTQVKEDALALFGFASKKELGLFEMLISVSNIGPKTAMAVLNLGNVDQILQAIAKADSDYFLQVPRVGKKNAQRIIVELRSKIGEIGEIDLTFEESKENKEIMQALLDFGFEKNEIKNVIKKLPKEGKIDQKLKLALKSLGKRQ